MTTGRVTLSKKKTNGTKNTMQSKALKARSEPTMPACTLKYALACSDPFDQGAIGACLPVAAVPSRKVKAFVEFDAYVGTNGVGFILITPTIANNVPSMYTTSAAFTGTFGAVLTANSTLATGVVRVNANTPYPAANFVGDRPLSQGRIVAAGIKCVYTGTNDKLAGLFYCYTSPDHAPLQNPTVASVGAFATTIISPVTRRECVLAVSAVEDDENDYKREGEVSSAATLRSVIYPYSTSAEQNGGFSDTVNGSEIGSPVAVVMFTGSPGESIHISYVVHLEYIGLSDQINLTPNPSDAAGVSMVMTAAKNMMAVKKANPTQSTWSIMAGELKSLWNQAKPIVVPAALNTLRVGLTAMGL